MNDLFFMLNLVLIISFITNIILFIFLTYYIIRKKESDKIWKIVDKKIDIPSLLIHHYNIYGSEN